MILDRHWREYTLFSVKPLQCSLYVMLLLLLPLPLLLLLLPLLLPLLLTLLLLQCHHTTITNKWSSCHDIPTRPPSRTHDHHVMIFLLRHHHTQFCHLAATVSSCCWHCCGRLNFFSSSLDNCAVIMMATINNWWSGSLVLVCRGKLRCTGQFRVRAILNTIFWWLDADLLVRIMLQSSIPISFGFSLLLLVISWKYIKNILLWRPIIP